MNTAERIQKLAMYKLAIATGDMSVDKTKSVGEKANDPEKLNKPKSFMDKLVDKMGPGLISIPIGKAVHGMEEYGNLMIDQNTPPIGELFSDFATDRLKKKGLKGEVYYTQTMPRTKVSASPKDNILKKIFMSIEAPKTESYSNYLRGSKPTPEWIRENIAEPFANDMTFMYETAKKYNPDILISKGDDIIQSSDRFVKADMLKDDLMGAITRKYNAIIKEKPDILNSDAIHEAIKSTGKLDELYKDPKVIVRTPRNNLRALAHEYGHVESNMGNDKILNSAIGSVYRPIRDILSAPLASHYKNHAPEGLQKFLGGISDAMDKNPVGSIINSVVQNNVLGKMRTLPVHAVTAINALSLISPDSMKKLKEKDPTGILNFVDEHPIASSVIASLPQVGREAATTIPGTKLTYDFWKALKDGNNEFMKNHVFTDDIRKGIKNLADINPGYEAAKFFGKNLGKTTLAVTAPLLGLAAIEGFKKWFGGNNGSSVDESAK